MRVESITRPGRTRTPAAHQSAGMTLLDTTLAIGVFALVLLMIIASLTVSTKVRRYAEEKDTASEAMKNEVARIQSLGLAGAVEELAAQSGAGLGTFPVPGLDRTSGPSGTISLVTNETLTDEDLGVSIGMPMDLDGDGLISNANTSLTATLVPVIATVTWEGVAGPTSLKTVVVLHRPKTPD